MLGFAHSLMTNNCEERQEFQMTDPAYPSLKRKDRNPDHKKALTYSGDNDTDR
jgi:hypothetical protein